MQLLILRWAIAWLCLCTASVSGTYVQDFSAPSSRRLILEDISLLLASFDVIDLCHPTSNKHAPIFPKCKQRTAHRRLEDEADDNAYQEGKNGDDQEDNQDDNNPYEGEQYYDDLYDDRLVESYNSVQEDVEEEVNTKWYYAIHASLTIICVIVGALASGLYVGMLSLDPLVLVIKSRTAKTENERIRLDNLLALIKRRHQLIVTLLIVNCVAAESMPIFLQHFVHDVWAVIVSVVLVLVFGEILPAIIFTGTDQLEVACRLVPIVRVVMCLLHPLAYPVAYLLEVLSSGGVDNVGVEEQCGGHRGGTVYSRGELAALIRVQYEERQALKQQRKAAAAQQISIYDIDNPNKVIMTSSIDLRNCKRAAVEQVQPSLLSIDSHDVNMLEGALQLKTKTALDVYVSFHNVFCISMEMELNESNVFQIYASGYSRVPVFVDDDQRKIQGILMTRQLMVVKQRANEQCPTPADLSLHTPRCVAPDTNLVELINMFQSGGRSSTKRRPGHMALVCARPQIGNECLERGEAVTEKAGLMGVITLEDVLEALIQDQIYDEYEMDNRPGSDEQVNDSSDSTAGGRRCSISSTKPLDEMATIQESNSYHQMA